MSFSKFILRQKLPNSSHAQQSFVMNQNLLWSEFSVLQCSSLQRVYFNKTVNKTAKYTHVILQTRGFSSVCRNKKPVPDTHPVCRKVSCTVLQLSLLAGSEMRPELSWRQWPGQNAGLDLCGHGMIQRKAAVLLGNSSRCAFFINQMELLLSDKHSDTGLVYPVLVQPSPHREKKRKSLTLQTVRVNYMEYNKNNYYSENAIISDIKLIYR